MAGELVIGLAVAIPIVLFPAAFVWYLTLGGIRAAAQEARETETAKVEAL